MSMQLAQEREKSCLSKEMRSKFEKSEQFKRDELYR